MDVASSPLVQTKICLPALRQRLVPRTRLVERMLSTGGAFTLVSAPAGYGKTTLLVEWAHTLLTEGVSTAWYALDAADDSPPVFAVYLAASLQRALGSHPGLSELSRRLRTSPEIDLQVVMPALINLLLSFERPCALILDDYHLITSPAIHTALAYLLEHLPGNLQLVIGSRADPPLPLARLRARGVFTEIRSAGLRFTPAETEQFLNGLMKLDLPAESVLALDERAEGWAAGLQLAALSLAGRADKAGFIASFGGSHRYLVEYLLQEVIERQPPRVQAFLIATSLLDRLSAPLCDALLGGSDAAEVLESLMQANLFVVALDDTGAWYRYHHLFRDFLFNRLVKEQPVRLAALRRTACEWLAQNGYLLEAARHAFQSGDWEYAAAFVERYALIMIIHSEIAALYEWCSAFPEAVMQAHPLLCAHQCWGLVLTFSRRNRPRIEARLAQAEKAAAALADRQVEQDLGELTGIIRSMLSMAPDPSADPLAQWSHADELLKAYPAGAEDAGKFSALLMRGYAQLALTRAAEAYETLELALHIAQREHLFFGVIESTFHLARLAHSQGRLPLAADLCRQGQADIAAMQAHTGQDIPALGCLDAALGCVLLEQDRLDEAGLHLTQAIERMGWGANPFYLMTACLGLYRLECIQKKPADADRTLVRLEETWPDAAFLAQGLRLAQKLEAEPGDADLAARGAAWCEHLASTAGGEAPPGLGPFGGAEVYYRARLVWARLQILLGQAASTAAFVDRQIELSEARGLGRRVIELSVLQAQAALAEGKRRLAQAPFERALALAESQACLRILDEAPALIDLLAETAARQPRSSFAGRLLAVYRGTDPVPTSMTPAGEARPGAEEWAEPLSRRELEVLRLLAQGASNRDIAEHFVLSVGTVKSHINHILGKLGAQNRTEAVARARRLGWI